MAKTYNLDNIRTLLTHGFGPDDLRRLIYDTPDFRPVYEELASNTGKAEIVSKLMEYAEKNLKMERLLALLQARNPTRYEHHQPYYSESSPASAPPDSSSTILSPESNVRQPVQRTVPPREKAGPEYVTYHVEVTPDGQAVHVTVTHPDGRGGGNPRGRFCLAEVRADILTLVGKVGREPRAATRRDLEQLGELLFGSLFCDAGLAEHFRTAYRQARERDQGLRLELDFDETRTPEIAALPWEFIRAPQTAGYPAITLATDPNLVLSRRRSLWEAPPQLNKRGAWSILLAVAAPDDPELGAVAYEGVVDELRSLTHASPEFARLGEPLVDTDAMKLDEALGTEPDILHFIGHGRFALEADDPHGELAMVGPGGWTEWLRDDDVGSLLERHIPAVVFLQACEGGALNSAKGLTGVASKIVQRNAPVVVAMQYPITNAAALLFARKFYERLAAGDPVDKAAQEGRRVLWFRFLGKREFATPVLFMRAPDGRLFTDYRRPVQGVDASPAGAAPQVSGDVITATGGSTVINRLSGAVAGSVPVSASSGRLNLERGLERMRALVTNRAPDFLNDFLTLESRLRDNLRSAGLFGEDQTIRSERARIIASLNDLAQRAGLEQYFNDLSRD